MSKMDWALLIVRGLLILFLGYQIGWLRGYDDKGEDMKKADCDWEYGNKPYSEIKGDCLKYFIGVSK